MIMNHSGLVFIISIFSAIASFIKPDSSLSLFGVLLIPVGFTLLFFEIMEEKAQQKIGDVK